MEEYYVGVLTEEGRCYIVPFAGDDIVELEEAIIERFGNGCNWQVLTDSIVSIGWGAE